MPRDFMPSEYAASSISPNDHALGRSANAADCFFGRRLRSIALFALIFVLHVLAAPQAANAQTMTATMSGTMSGTDGTGVFGAPGSFTNVPFTLSFTFDGAGSQATSDCSGVPCSSYDESSGSANPGTATLNGWAFGGGILPTSSITSKAYIQIPNSGTYTVSDEYNNTGVDTGNDGVSASVGPSSGTPPLSTNYSWAGSFTRTTGLSGSTGSFNIDATDDRTHPSTSYVASGSLAIDSITVSGPVGSNSTAKALGKTGCTCGGTSGPTASTNTTTTSPQGSSASPQAADPVNLATGNMFKEITDYTTAGPNPLSFIRYYNSLGNGPGLSSLAGSPGTNWRTNYDRYLQIEATTIIAERPDGQQVDFSLSGSTWVPDSDVDMTLTQSGTTYTLTDQNDNVEVYNIASTYFGTTLVHYGQLASITARNGYTQTLTYSSNQLQSVTDSYGRSLSFTYTAAYVFAANGFLASGSGLLHTVTTPDGLVLTFTQTAVTGGNQLTSVSYNTSPVTSQTYLYGDSSYPFALTGIDDENGNQYATWTYDAYGNAITSQNGTGGSVSDLTTMTYNSNGTTTVTNALGVADTYTFSNTHNLLRVTGISRAATSTTATATRTFGYDTNGFMNSETDWNGNETTYVNNSHGQPTTINEAVGSSVARTTTISYGASSGACTTFVHLPCSIVTTGLTSSFTYDGNGDALTRTDLDTTTNSIPYSTNGQSRVTTWTWSSTGQMTSIQLPRTDVTAKTTFGYTGGTLTSITDPLSHVTTINTYTSGGLPTKITDPNGVVTTLVYDARLNLNTATLHTGAGNLVTTWTHDPANQLTALQLPDGSKLTYAHDTAHRLTTITDLFGNTVNYTLDALGDKTLTQVENSSATVTRKHSATFDALGRVLDDIGGVSQTTVYTYDKNGNALTVTPPSPSGVITRTYDALNRLKTSVDPSPGGTTTLTYDAHDRVLTAEDANSHTTSYVYDGFGDRTQVTSPDSGTTVLTYDPDRNLTQSVKAGSLTADMTYDADDRNLTATYPSQTSLNVALTYDQTGAYGFGIGHLTSWTDATGSGGRIYDERGDVTGESRVIGTLGTLNTSTAYDAASRVDGITYPSGTVVLYTRDSMGRVTGLTAEPPGGTGPTNIATSITYEPFGPVASLTYGNGVTGAYGFDLDYRPTTRVDTGTAAVQNLTYAYYANNSVETITDAVNAANSQSLNYDALDRLTSATSGTGGYGAYSWTWDKVRNVETQIINGTTTTYTLNSGTNQLEKWVTGSTTENVASTAAGNLNTLKIGTTTEETLTYNQANQLATASTPSTSASYGYDLFGLRLEKAESGLNPIAFQYGNHGELLAENDFHSGQVADYIYLNGRPIGEVNPANGNIYFTHTDRLGTPQTLTNLAQGVVWNALYSPFGVSGVTGTLATQSLRLPGQYYDPETGMNHNGFRDYSGATTRYVESDPIGLGGGMNTFQYVGGNPFKGIDPLGLWQFTAIAGDELALWGTIGYNSGQWNIGVGVGLGFGGSLSYDNGDSGLQQPGTQNAPLHAEGECGFGPHVNASSTFSGTSDSGSLAVGLPFTPYSVQVNIENGTFTFGSWSVGAGSATFIGKTVTQYYPVGVPPIHF
jgi:RHS repeat-associated protein